MEWVSDCCLTPISIFSAITWKEQVIFQWDDNDVSFVVDQHVQLDFYSASSLEQQSVDTQTHYQSVDTQTHYQSVDTQTHYQSVDTHTHYQSVDTQTHYQSVDTQTHYQSVDTQTHYQSVDTQTHYTTDAVLKICKELKTQNRWSPLNLSFKLFYNVRFTISIC